MTYNEYVREYRDSYNAGNNGYGFNTVCDPCDDLWVEAGFSSMSHNNRNNHHNDSRRITLKYYDQRYIIHNQFPIHVTQNGSNIKNG